MMGSVGGPEPRGRQIADIVSELDRARLRLRRFADGVSEDAWTRRPSGSGWSAAECVVHLNLTGRAFVPILERALDEARGSGARVPARYRRDLVGWLVWWGTGPLPRRGSRSGRIGRIGRFRAPTGFVPVGDHPKLTVLAEFDRLQEAQIALTTSFDGLPLQAVKVVSPFDARLRYNVYACLLAIPRHQHRHLDQAERAAE